MEIKVPDQISDASAIHGQIFKRQPLAVEDFSSGSIIEPDHNSNCLEDLLNTLVMYIKKICQFLMSFCANDNKDLLEQLFACLCEKGLGEEETVKKFSEIFLKLDSSIRVRLVELVKSQCEKEKPKDVEERLKEVFCTGDLYRSGYVAEAINTLLA